VRDLTGITDPLNPNDLRRAGFSAARNVTIAGDLPAKLPTQFSMIGAEKSPLSYNGIEIYDSIRDKRIKASDYNLQVPKGVTSLLPTTSGTVGVMAFSGCALFDKGEPCEFCTVGGTTGKVELDPEKVVNELRLLIEVGYNPKNITINTGQPPGKGNDLALVGRITQALRDAYPDLPVAAEVGPFSFLDKGVSMETLKEYGLDTIDTFMINVELIRDSARKRLSPGKPTLDEYISVIGGLTDLGYNVSTVVQLNFYPEMQDITDYEDYFKRLAEVGRGKAIPELLISRAVPGSRLSDSYWKAMTGTKTDVLGVMIERFVDFGKRIQGITQAYNKFGFDSSKFNAGCVSCGMCNLNKEVYGK